METATRQVKIGPNFFAGAFRDYSNWHWAWVREICQNSQDSLGCNRIEVEIKTLDQWNTPKVYEEEFKKEEITLVKVTNNGQPMTEDILVNKFLCLGETGKSFANGAVGGFGKAKELLGFCHINWKIRTGSLIAIGEGGEYSLRNSDDYLHGTETTVTMKGDLEYDLIRQFKIYASQANWHGTLVVNGEELETNLAPETHRKDFDWGSIYTNKESQFPGKVIVRIKGIPMFSRSVDYKELVIIELKDSKAITANRDYFNWSASNDFDTFIDEVNMNKRAAFQDAKEDKTKRTKFHGYKLAGRFQEASINENVKVESPKVQDIFSQIEAARSNMTSGYDNTVVVGSANEYFRPEFFLRNELDEQVPTKYLPDTLSPNSVKLINNWVNILIEMATLVNLKEKFSVGFVFSEDSEAMYERNCGDHIIYINPGTKDKFKDYWTSKNYWQLVANAAHEICHMEGFHKHNEDYANRLTDIMALVLSNKSKFSSKSFEGKWNNESK